MKIPRGHAAVISIMHKPYIHAAVDECHWSFPRRSVLLRFKPKDLCLMGGILSLRQSRAPVFILPLLKRRKDYGKEKFNY